MSEVVNGVLHLPWLLLGTELGLADGYDRLLLLTTALLWFVAGMYARTRLPDQPERRRFFIYFLPAMAGNLGLIFAQDMVSFYSFFALMSFSAYGLVVHKRGVEALYAGRIYIAFVVIGELALFAALVLVATAVGSTAFDDVRPALAQAESRNLILSLTLIGFGIKTGVIGLHGWMPLVYPAAPTPASAVLAGAMINGGLLGWLRLFEFGNEALIPWGEAFMVLGLAAAFYGVVVGLTQRDAKALLAYSSVSQMGILTMAIGLGLSAPDAVPGLRGVIILYALHHGLSKAALFLGVGILGACSDRRRRLLWMAMWLPALALAGAPLTSGMVAKSLLKAQTVNAPDAWVPVLHMLLPWSAVITALLMARFLFLLAQPAARRTKQPLPIGLFWPWALLVTILILSPWWSVRAMPDLWSTATVLGGLWPLLVAMGLAFAAISWRSLLIRRPLTGAQSRLHIPPGDLLLPVIRGLAVALEHGLRLCGQTLPRWHEARLRSLKKLGSIVDWWRLLDCIEFRLGQWQLVTVTLVLLGLVLVWVGASS